MTAKLRHPRIIEIARTEGKVTVDGLAAMLDVTEQTVRRDLAALADAGQLERVHGGAVLPLGTRNMAYAERQRLNHQAKTQIGLAAAKRIPDDICLFLPAAPAFSVLPPACALF